MRDKCSFSIDNTLVIQSWSPNMEKFSHRQAADLIGRNAKDVFPLLHDKILAVFRDGRKKLVKDFKNTCFMGTDLCADLQIIPVKNNNGQVVEVTVELNTISGRCPLRKQLADSEKMVAIGKVASSLAHGVRNPLNAIKGAVVYLREKYMHESTLLEFSTIIYDEINKLDSFISNFLSTARGETNFLPVNLNDVLQSIIRMVKLRTEIQNIEVVCDLTPLPGIAADPFHIEQAIFNIINNAIEAMPKGGKMNIKTSLKWEGDNDYAVIEISDTGVGIPEKKLRKLGELVESSERHDKGFGIFLSREVIKTHKGKLLWESVRDRGTTFKIFLPVRHSGK